MKKIFIICSLLVFFVANAQVGINITNPRYDFEVNGILGSTPQTLSEVGSYMTSTVVSVQPTNTNDIFYLPNPLQYPGAILFVRNVTTVTAQIITPENSIINASNVGGANNFYMIGSENSNTKTIMFVSDGVNWTAFKPAN